MWGKKISKATFFMPACFTEMERGCAISIAIANDWTSGSTVSQILPHSAVWKRPLTLKISMASVESKLFIFHLLFVHQFLWCHLDVLVFSAWIPCFVMNFMCNRILACTEPTLFTYIHNSDDLILIFLFLSLATLFETFVSHSRNLSIWLMGFWSYLPLPDEGLRSESSQVNFILHTVFYQNFT